MEDKQIVGLYWERNPDAISETALKYGSYLKSIARNILNSDEDAEECLNDTYLNAWNSMPPHRPDLLSAYLGKIIRNLSFDRFRRRHAGKRGGGELELVLEELAECVSGSGSIEQKIEEQELLHAINSFLDTLPQKKCSIFLCRYWYAAPIAEIAKQFQMTEGNVSVILNRIRNKLKTYLIERGYSL